MTPDRVALLERIRTFEIDGPNPVALPFAARLAREHDWSRPYADRVIREYKRYIFLAATANEPVCPSEDVDAAWHLHLTYTRSYWKHFCGEVLGTPLHHEPTKGGPAESDKHLRMYQHTLAVYRESFGDDPPSDIWPQPDQRFGRDPEHRVVNTARNWVIPKLPVKRIFWATAAGTLTALFVPGCAGGEWNPFNLTGANFLVFLIPAMIAAMCLGRVIRARMMGPDPLPGDDHLDLNWEQTAYLAGGSPRLLTAALARLVENGITEISEDKKHIIAGKHRPTEGFSPVETAVMSALPVARSPRELKYLQDAVEARYGREAANFEQKGFILPRSKRVAAVLAALLPVILVILLLGLPRLAIGTSNGKPAGYLIATIVIGGFIGLLVSMSGNLRLTRRGKNALAWLRSQNVSFNAGNIQYTSGSAGLAVALFGTAALVSFGMVSLETWFPRKTSTNWGSGCGSGCGTSSGGDGGGCGGGCGGCGGGD